MQKERMKKVDKKKASAWIQYGIIAAATISLGIAGGIIIKKKFGGEEITYSGFDPETFKADSKALLKEYEKNPKKEFTAPELVNIGQEKYRNCTNCYSIQVGLADTVVKQYVRNAQIKVGESYWEEAISKSSMVSLANRYTQKGDAVNLYKGKATSEEVGEYNKKDVTNYKKDDFKKDWGKTLDEMFIYIISNKTVNLSKCKTEKKETNIRVTLDLDPAISTYYYKIQMKTMSNLSGLPTFEYVKQVYTFDSNMTLLHCKTEEKYKASMAGVNAEIINTLDTYFHANKKIKIPELNQKVNYSLEGEAKYE